jgi:hypothetical protein
MRAGPFVALATGLVLGGCAATSAWTPVETGGLRPVALAASGDGLLVAGATDSGPALLRLGTGGPVTFDLAPAEPYAAQATLVAVSATATAVDAIGTVVGGAHGNPRWTIWDGTTSPPELASHPQEFFTFGGHDAGPLLAVLETPSGPAILGSRTTNTGSRAVLYTRSGTTWSPRPSPDALTSTADVQLGFSSAATSGERTLVAGDELLLANGLEQRPVIWLGGPRDDWRRIELPTGGIAGSGLSRATSVACGHDTCWVAGWVRGHPVGWSLDIATATPTLMAVLPGDPPPGNDPAALIAVVSGRPVVATNAAAPSVQLDCPQGWRALPSPGRVSALVAVGGQLYAIADGALTRLDAPAC